MHTMKAVRKSHGRVGLADVPVPALGPGDALVRVEAVGVCRTDVLVARGLLPAADPLTLGHEFAGVVEAVAGAAAVAPGDRVAALPLIPCGACPVCARGDGINCPRRAMLGVERDGAFASYVALPADLLFRVPASLPFAQAAYAEPVAAALGVLGAGLPPGGRGLVLGENRFAVLLERLLRLHGHHDLCVGTSDEEDAFDFVVETGLSDGTLSLMLRAARPGGTLVLRSRRPGAFALDAMLAVRKQLTLRAVNYGPFRRGLALLVEGALDWAGLLGPCRPLAEFAEVFDRAERDEGAKWFFAPWE